jgi:hypothetical protein
MLSLDQLMEDPLLQVWDAHRVVTALTRALLRCPSPDVQRWFFFPRSV